MVAKLLFDPMQGGGTASAVGTGQAAELGSFGGTTRLDVAIGQFHGHIYATQQVMKTIEYKHIRFAPGFLTYISPRKFGPAMMAMLAEESKDGWELRGTFHEGFEIHVHFIFAREAMPQSQPPEKRPA